MPNSAETSLREPKCSSKYFTNKDLRALLWAKKWCNGEGTIEAEGFAIGEADALIEWSAGEIERLRARVDDLEHERLCPFPCSCGGDGNHIKATFQEPEHTVAWYIMEVRHRNAVIGVAKQYLIDGEPERALAILRQVGNGIGDADSAKAPSGTVLISTEEHNRLRIAAGENPL